MVNFHVDSNRYVLGELLGSDADGVTIRAHDRFAGSFVAIKRITHSGNTSDKLIHITRELKILHSLRNHSVVTLHDIEIDEECVYIITESCDTSLSQIIQMRERPKCGYMLMMYQILNAIDFIHSAGIVHRDIKPNTILISAGYKIKLSEFGLAREAEDDALMPIMIELIDPLQNLISMCHRAPEIVLYPRRYGKSQDIWAAACTFAEMIQCNPLIPGDSITRNFPVRSLDRFGRYIKEELEFEVIRIEKALSWTHVIHNDLYPLMQQMLQLNPKDRISAHNACSLSIFHDSRQRLGYVPMALPPPCLLVDLDRIHAWSTMDDIMRHVKTELNDIKDGCTSYAQKMNNIPEKTTTPIAFNQSQHQPHVTTSTSSTTAVAVAAPSSSIPSSIVASLFTSTTIIQQQQQQRPSLTSSNRQQPSQVSVPISTNTITNNNLGGQIATASTTTVAGGVTSTSTSTNTPSSRRRYHQLQSIHSIFTPYYTSSSIVRDDVARDRLQSLPTILVDDIHHHQQQQQLLPPSSSIVVREDSTLATAAVTPTPPNINMNPNDNINVSINASISVPTGAVQEFPSSPSSTTNTRTRTRTRPRFSHMFTSVVRSISRIISTTTIGKVRPMNNTHSNDNINDNDNSHINEVVTGGGSDVGKNKIHVKDLKILTSKDNDNNNDDDSKADSESDQHQHRRRSSSSTSWRTERTRQTSLSLRNTIDNGNGNGNGNDDRRRATHRLTREALQQAALLAARNGRGHVQQGHGHGHGSYGSMLLHTDRPRTVLSAVRSVLNSSFVSYGSSRRDDNNNNNNNNSPPMGVAVQPEPFIDCNSYVDDDPSTVRVAGNTNSNISTHNNNNNNNNTDHHDTTATNTEGFLEVIPVM
eukprot:gene115-168_t